jgi:chemotaxis response regulator CheB
MDRQAVSVTAPAAAVGELQCSLDVVAIGASAGGISALPTILSALPAAFPAAVIVVQHLDPHYRSFLASVLARACRLPVQEAVGGEIIKAGVVYVAPRAVHLVLRGGALVLTDAAPVHSSVPRWTCCSPRSLPRAARGRWE